MYTPDTNGQSSPTTNNNKPNILSKFGKGRLGENNQVSKFSKSKEIVDENNSNMRTCNGKYIIFNIYLFNIFYLLGFFTPSSPLFKIDLLVQKDITFIMHRSVELWRTWYTEPMPNIGTYSYVRTRMRLLEFANIHFDHLF